MEYIYKGKISGEFIDKALKMYELYKSDKQSLNDRICENEKWYRKWHEVNIQNEFNDKNNSLSCSTAYLFSAIENKYADAIDNFPYPRVLEREPQDIKAAELLSKILPVQLDLSDFKKCYKKNWRRKLKYGTGAYGVFYNRNKEAIEIKALNVLGIYCDMNIQDIQQSPFLFITQAFDNESLRVQYPEFSELFLGDANIDTYNGRVSAPDKTEIVDCYYKKPTGEVHLIKFARGVIIDASEDTEGYEKGLYEHGLYPVVFDTLYPCDDAPFGYGVIDVIKNPQMYIDKLDSVILKNAVLSGKQRWLIKDKGAINEEEFKDWSKDIIHVEGSLDETHIRPVQAGAISDFVIQHRLEKISELKEVIGNRDFQQGATNNGVTAASAISALQMAGEKLSRANIDDSFDAYREIVTIVIELIREFYDEEKVYRITNELGNIEYVSFSNEHLKISKDKDILGLPRRDKKRKAEFDIEVIPERQSPSSRESNNQLILELWKNGLFSNANPNMAIMVLESLNFDGKERILEQLKKMNYHGGENYGI